MLTWILRYFSVFSFTSSSVSSKSSYIPLSFHHGFSVSFLFGISRINSLVSSFSSFALPSYQISHLYLSSQTKAEENRYTFLLQKLCAEKITFAKKRVNINVESSTKFDIKDVENDENIQSW